MAKKNSNAKKSVVQTDETAEASLENAAASEAAASVTQEDETPPTKAKAKAGDDSSSNGNVGIGDIRKAVAFSNSVGGLDKAIAILQILKVAKEVQ